MKASQSGRHSPRLLISLAQAVWDKGGLLDNSIIGFVDGSGTTTQMPSKRAAAKRKGSKFTTVDVQKYAYCGGKTGAHGVVLQALQQVDAITVAHVELLSQHDSTVLRYRYRVRYH